MWYLFNYLYLIETEITFSSFYLLTHCSKLFLLYRDRTCEATSMRVNEGRKVDGTSEIGNKKPSIRPDLLLIRKEVEYGCSEVGKVDDTVPSRKEIIETQLHCPKIMKDIFFRAANLANNDEDMLRKLCVVCFHQTSCPQ